MSPWKFALPALVLLLAGCNLWPVETNPYTTIHPSTDFNAYILELYSLITWWVSAIGVIVGALLIYILVRFRDDGQPGNPKQIHGNPQLEFAWTLLPVLIVIAIAVPTIRTIFVLGNAAPANAVEVRVIGKRWWWAFEYLESGVVTANEMHVPAGVPISLLIESDSVIHSFWVPRLGGKRDAVPGRINRMWFTITDEPTPGEPLEYLGECAEFCGEQHAMMRMRVYAHTPADFDQWVVDMQTPVTFADEAVKTRGEELFSSAGCAGCHQVVGNKMANGRSGPSLTRYAERHSIGAGAALFDYWDPAQGRNVAISDEQKRELLYKWLEDPNQIKSGTTKEDNASRALDGMNIPRELSADEINALVDYLLALK